VPAIAKDVASNSDHIGPHVNTVEKILAICNTDWGAGPMVRIVVVRVAWGIGADVDRDAGRNQESLAEADSVQDRGWTVSIEWFVGEVGSRECSWADLLVCTSGQDGKSLA